MFYNLSLFFWWTLFSYVEYNYKPKVLTLAKIKKNRSQNIWWKASRNNLIHVSVLLAKNTCGLLLLSTKLKSKGLEILGSGWP